MKLVTPELWLWIGAIKSQLRYRQQSSKLALPERMSSSFNGIGTTRETVRATKARISLYYRQHVMKILDETLQEPFQQKTFDIARLLIPNYW